MPGSYKFGLKSCAILERKKSWKVAARACCIAEILRETSRGGRFRPPSMIRVNALQLAKHAYQEYIDRKSCYNASWSWLVSSSEDIIIDIHTILPILLLGAPWRATYTCNYRCLHFFQHIHYVTYSGHYEYNQGKLFLTAAVCTTGCIFLDKQLVELYDLTMQLSNKYDRFLEILGDFGLLINLPQQIVSKIL